MNPFLYKPEDYPDLVKDSNGWKQFIITQFGQEYFHKISEKINENYESFNKELDVFPPKSLTFKALELTPFENIKVVLIGQDPYIRPGQAMGLCFSVPKGVTVPPSLVNVYKELLRDPKVTFQRPSHGDLTEWAKQGVLLLNPILTVREGKSGSHATFGWKTFTQRVIEKISKEKRGVVFLLWGTHAHVVETLIDTNKHYILKAGHPSPMNQSNPFVGCGCFSKTNELLERHGLTPIDWNKINENK
jgi:uracil-DNA glycosylase